MPIIHINIQKKQNKISPLLYGIFFEDINYGGDGGLYAELIANRSFEYYDRDHMAFGKLTEEKSKEDKHDKPIKELHEERLGQANGVDENKIYREAYGGALESADRTDKNKMCLETYEETLEPADRTDKHKMCWKALPGTEFGIETKGPLNEIHTRYARISGGRGCGITNTGFCGEGFSVKAGKIFRFSCYARVTEDTNIAVDISDKHGNRYARQQILCISRKWHKYETELMTDVSCPNVFLSVVLPEGGSAELEFLSLFPKDTFCGRENGMRKDIAEMIRDMKPKFMRFPGGCIVEGRSFENMYRWKDTIGPVWERRTNWNRWQMEEYQHLGHDASDYFQSYGIGFYEYFLFCEDIGAKPVPVVNCGMTCQWHEGLLVDLEELMPFVQDVFDLIEFANGDENSIWGKKRAEMGHREPFGLEYIAIGNEQWGEAYFARYEIFEKKIAEKYPDIKLITSAGWKDRGWEFELAYGWLEQNKEKAYAVDEHFYKEPEWFLENVRRYDTYDRSLPKVLIGEYAAHTAAEIKDRKNNWYAALAEAAFLTGVERNADHVVMSCYAPLLARIDHQQWQPNLIWFDKDSVYGTPSYYVQKLFSEYVGDVVVEHECEDHEIKISASVKADQLIVKLVNVSGEDKKIKFDVDTDVKPEKAVTLWAEISAENTVSNPLCVYPKEIGSDQIKDYCDLKGNSVMLVVFQLSGMA